jgi:polar amino acid transport system substrate-binding protein
LKNTIKIIGVILAVTAISVIIWFFTLSMREEESSSIERTQLSRKTTGDDTILVADDHAEWPPYLLADSTAPDGVAGASVVLLRKVLESRGYSVKIDRFPWARALHLVATGSFHILNNASSNPERMRTYYRSNPIYQISHAFFYRKERFPNGLPITTQEDVDDFYVGGMRGYNFGLYKFDIDKIHQVDSVDALFGLIGADRVDFVIGYPEIYHSLEKQGKISLAGIETVKIPDTSPLIFYVWVSRTIDNPEGLLEDINAGLQEFEANGNKRKIFTGYGLFEQ